MLYMLVFVGEGGLFDGGGREGGRSNFPIDRSNPETGIAR